MSKTSGNLGDNSSVGPDFFGLFKSEVAELLSQDGVFWPSSHQSSDPSGNLAGLSRENYRFESSSTIKNNNSSSSPASLYLNGVGALLSEFGKERLKLLLRQSVSTLSLEVDEVVNPVISLCRVRSCLRYKESLLLCCNGSSQLVDQQQHSSKKLKVLTSSLLLCNPCELGLANGVETESSMCPHSEAYRDNVEIDDDIRFLLENDSNKVEELMNTHSNELLTTLKHMEQTLEELLNVAMTTCRPMTVHEKQQLQKLIKDLPSKNVGRVLEILRHSKPSRKDSYDEVYIDLDEEDEVTLWRLYFYVATAQNASTL